MNLKNTLFNFCVGVWVGGHPRAKIDIFWSKSHDSGAQWVKPTNENPAKNWKLRGLKLRGFVDPAKFWTSDRMHLNAFLGIADNIGWKWYNHNVEYSRINAICSTFSSVQTRKDFTFIFSIRFKGEWTYCHTPHIPYHMVNIIFIWTS